ncbi:MAG: hypothetical protein AAGC85_03050 [Bacteroidota bacterium]
MKRLLTFIVSFFCILIPFYSSAQSDEINISAAFSSSIDLRVTDGANINFTFATLEDYQNGKGGTSKFEVASSVNFSVDMSITPFVNAEGDEIDPKNLCFRVGVPIARASEEGVRWVFGSGNAYDKNYTTSAGIYGPLHYSTSTPRTVLTPGSKGNAGSYEDNQFHLSISFGNPNHKDLPAIQLPILLDQNIAPGTYTCTVTLEAIPEAL